jgi:hypothetical protein
MKSRHIVGGHGPVKSLAFVEELGRLNHPRDWLTFSRPNSTSVVFTAGAPTPTYYVLDVWRIIGE